MKPPLLPLMLASSFLTACAAQGTFPSLSPRAAEYELAGREPPPCIAAAGVQAEPGPSAAISVQDPQLASRLAELIGNAQRGERKFQALLPQTRTAVGRAGASGSESWIAAQQEISRLEAARAPTADALGELEALTVARASDSATSEPDRQRIRAAVEEVGRMAEAQRASINALTAVLSGPSALRNAPLQAPHSGAPRAAAPQALAESDRGYISPADRPRAAPTGSVCRG